MNVIPGPRAMVPEEGHVHFADEASPRPDVRPTTRDRVAALKHPVYGFVPQPNITDTDAFGIVEVSDTAGATRELEVSLSYGLRAAGSRQTSTAALDADAWKRVIATQPVLWEAVKTHVRDPSNATSLEQDLADHASHILRNRHQSETASDELHLRELLDRPRVTAGDVRAGAVLTVDGRALPAAEIDAHPNVYAIGARLSPTVSATVVVGREFLPQVQIALATKRKRRSTTADSP